jgi:trans-aconitate 2-methyltransferase
MLRQARERLPKATFIEANIAHWPPPPGTDVLFANAVFQWVPDHIKQLKRLVLALPAGGALAVQMPDNMDEPAHALMRRVAGEEAWGGKLARLGGKRATVWPAAWYYALLKPLCARVDIWRTTYHHVLPGGAAAVVEWFKGSGLRPYLAPLDTAEQARFHARYEAAVAEAYGVMADGTLLLPFPRLFIVATMQATTGAKTGARTRATTGAAR